MTVTIVMVTHNRLEYTRKTLPRLLEDPKEQFDLYLWDNASTDETPDYLKEGVKDPRIVEVVLSKENVGQTGAMNYVWRKTKAELVGKLDNDCLVTPGWTRIFTQAHHEIQNLGAVAMWHFFPEDFDYEKAKQKIQAFNGHQIFRHPWVCGSGFIIKRETFLKQGPWVKGENVGTTGYFLNMASAGYINGWYYPFIYQEHMDDPKSSHCLIRDEESFRRYENITFSLKARLYRDISGRLKRREVIVRNLLDDPFEPRYYVGWGAKLRRLKSYIQKNLRW